RPVLMNSRERAIARVRLLVLGYSSVQAFARDLRISVVSTYARCYTVPPITWRSNWSTWGALKIRAYRYVSGIAPYARSDTCVAAHTAHPTAKLHQLRW